MKKKEEQKETTFKKKMQKDIVSLSKYDKHFGTYNKVTIHKSDLNLIILQKVRKSGFITDDIEYNIEELDEIIAAYYELYPERRR